MNEQIQALAEQAGFILWADEEWKPEGETIDWSTSYDDELVKLVELVVRECIAQAHAVANLRGITDDMIYGADTAAVVISKHFGVK